MRGDSHRRGGSPWWAAPLLVLGMALAAGLLRRRFTRFEISGDSMLPALAPGDWVIVDRDAYTWRDARPGEVVLAADPRDPSRTIAKRVASVDFHGGAFLLGDNADASTDSRTFGPVGRQAIYGRVRWRYAPWSRIGRVP